MTEWGKTHVVYDTNPEYCTDVVQVLAIISKIKVDMSCDSLEFTFKSNICQVN